MIFSGSNGRRSYKYELELTSVSVKKMHALNRLHLGKSSLDWLTAEMLRQLPHDELIKNGGCDPGNVPIPLFRSKLDCNYGFVDTEESSHEIFV